MEKVALFPGSFDPFTIGHMIVVEKALGIFDRIVIAIGTNGEKRGLLTSNNRLKLIHDIFADEPRVDVRLYNSLTGECCRELGIKTILRGLRNSVDYEYERNIAQINQTLFPEIETVLLFTPAQYVAISSSVIRELISFGADPSHLLPNNINIKNYL